LHDGPNCKKDEAESTLARSDKAGQRPEQARSGAPWTVPRQFAMTLPCAIKETNNNSPLAPFQRGVRNARGAAIPTSCRNKALLFAAIGTI